MLPAPGSADRVPGSRPVTRPVGISLARPRLCSQRPVSIRICSRTGTAPAITGSAAPPALLHTAWLVFIRSTRWLLSHVVRSRAEVCVLSQEARRPRGRKIDVLDYDAA